MAGSGETRAPRRSTATGIPTGNAALVLQLRVADLHLLHDAGRGGHAVSGVRGAGWAHPGVVTPASRMYAASRVPVATFVLVAVNVLVFLAEMAQGAGVRGGVGGSSLVDDGSIDGAGDRRRRAAAPRDRRVPPRRPAPPRLQHVPALDPGRGARALRGALAMLAIYFSAPLWGSAGAALLSSGFPHGGGLGRGLRPDGGPLPAGAPARGGPAGRLGRRAAGREPGLHVRVPGRLHRRAHRGTSSAGRPRPSPSRGSAGATWPTGEWACGAGGRWRA